MKERDYRSFVVKFFIAFLFFTILGAHGSAGSTWTIDTVDANGGDFRFTSLKLDTSGNPHISYQNCNDEGLRYATLNGTGWAVEVVDSDNRTGFWTALDLDHADYPHIVCFSLQDSDLEYRWKNESGWQSDNPPTHGNASWNAAPFRLGSDGYPRIIMVDRFTTGLVYFWENESGWQTETIPDTRYSSYPDLILDRNDQPHVSFLCERANTGYARYAVRDCTGWKTEIVNDSVNTWGAATSIRLDDSGYPRIGFYDRTGLDLMYAWRNESGWLTEIAVSRGNVGDQCCLAIDREGFPHLSYYNASESALAYSRKDGPGWFSETVDEGGIGTGWYGSLVLDANDSPYISYGDYPTGSLKLARMENAQNPANLSITATAGSGGTILPSGVIEVQETDSITLQMLPDPGFVIDNLFIDGQHCNPATEYTFSEVRKNHTINATFAPSGYTIVSSAGEGGAILPRGEVGIDHGGEQTFTISPDPGYEVGSILIDGEPFEISSRIVSSADERDSRQMTFRNVTGNHTLHVEFVRMEGTVVEILDPAGAAVYIDGEARGIVPVILTDIAPGRHSIRLSLEGFQDWSKKVNVVKDVVNTVSARLTPIQTGSISIQSTPEGASIILDGKETGNTTPSILSPIDAGEHTLRLTCPGYAPWEKTVEVRSNAMVHIIANLRKGAALF
jgi:hypothetical protein